MKKVKGFNVGDKVFAKVKGYPAWPAIITEVHNTRYEVRFYGTGETGSVKPKDLFYYLKHKNSFVKSLKRKDYNEAIEEIENAIRECGTDGNNEEDSAADTTTSSNASANDSVDSSKSNKRKRSASVSSEKFSDLQTKKKVSSRSSTPAYSATASVSEESETVQEDKNDTTDLKENSADANTHDLPRNKQKSETSTDVKQEDGITKSPTKIQNKSQEVDVKKHLDVKNVKDEMASEGIGDLPMFTNSDIKIITDDYLHALIAYAEHVRKNAEIYKKKPAENRNYSKNEVVIVKLPEGKLVGIRYNQDPTIMQNEYEQAEYDKSEANTILSLKAVIEKGSCKPDDDPHLFITNLNMNEEQLQEIVEMDVIERKRTKLRWLKIESSLAELDAKIKGCLALDKAEPSMALQHLETMSRLEIEPLMLKKHPHVVDMIKRLRRYIGNVKEWKMTEDEREQFEADAGQIRIKAYDIYAKFAKLFGVEDYLFWERFTEEVREFKEQTKHMEDRQVFALCSEPNTRETFFNRLDDEEEMKIILSKIEKIPKVIKPEKENSSKVANTIDNQNEVLVGNSNVAS